LLRAILLLLLVVCLSGYKKCSSVCLYCFVNKSLWSLCDCLLCFQAAV